VSSDLEFDEPDRFTAGTVGPAGARVFYLQVRQHGAVASLRLEKQQVAALAEYLGGMLADLPAPSGELPADLSLIEPVVAEWVVGSLAVAYHEIDDRFLVVAEELVLVETEEGAPEPEEPPDGATARLHLTREQVAAFVPHAVELVSGGRPLCPICGRPIDPDGHVCPRSNGHGH
jgi:uncharacterized repeat protein (TIGR03847 family)